MAMTTKMKTTTKDCLTPTQMANRRKESLFKRSALEARIEMINKKSSSNFIF